MNDFFLDLFNYHFTVNQQLGELLLHHQDQVSEKARALFNHVVNAHQIWNSRIDPQLTATGVWATRDIREAISCDRQNAEHSRNILQRVALSDNISYQNTKGQAFNRSVQDILFHIINHSSYHRGQIASECKASGIPPLVSDYIFVKQ